MLFLVASLLSLVFAAAAQRQFEINNNCAETLWPALTNQGPENLRSYSGLRGWMAPPGHRQTLSLPENWNGRIWPRRMCNFNYGGSGSCVTGSCESGINCKDHEGDFFSLGEFNLNSWGGLDFYDLSFVAGFDVPMSIAPDGCQRLACTPDITAICPDERMKKRDASGRVLGCRSACFAGINAEVPSMNCCSGIYESIPACVPEHIDFYGLFKPICPNAFWYPRDQREGNPQVDWACPAGSKPKYTITFCPREGAKIGSMNVGTSPSRARGSYPSNSFVMASARAIVNASSTTGPASTGGASTSESATMAGASTSSASAASSDPPLPPKAAAAGNVIFGMAETVFYVICAVAGFIVLVGHYSDADPLLR
ncbi:hypothetical protein JCM3774_000119 [Rhodotorula dairenensis]